jgi:hypothetical protein
MYIEDTSINVGSQGTVDIVGFNINNIVTGNIYVQYNQNYLTYVSSSAGGSGFISHDSVNHVVKILPLFISGPQSGDIPLGSITFKRINTGSTDLSFNQGKTQLRTASGANYGIYFWYSGTID